MTIHCYNSESPTPYSSLVSRPAADGMKAAIKLVCKDAHISTVLIVPHDWEGPLELPALIGLAFTVFELVPVAVDINGVRYRMWHLIRNDVPCGYFLTPEFAFRVLLTLRAFQP